ncbi:DNA polymerase II [Sulfolobus sp. A20]|uniref:DNA polymerase II n=1 Tax=Sulfolobaceae TaxID=118883 RepID=UPI000845EF9A|nr:MULTISPECIES: DNA polymerase II [unclassified Sulfolobus]TRM76005.1 DNA polymerase II [Sulfolobus sp. B5]TRM78099.1 DNA polymerase II [Sulfolobus sp. A20-N-F8]TRM82487.1 DNA polymerase II [Sulfolobus sp. D5]TRM85548.1 DNA polymerase II [Sulfolobus sp. F3]TRM88205.1 DNA polymerase II [Sulfolobus sp. C3]TRM94624.1 DNA polymerase II [Sulfolobus sp. A20-N-G8]TRN01430.1 DNA polymerase II [Sulfolobus sp. F1]TRN04051.1 DNA polymerase II [Sulfolobus sp. E1]
MGRTQPSFTKVIDDELNKLSRLSKRLSYPCFDEVILEASKRIRYFQSALYDEVSDPQEIVFLAIISVLAERVCNKSDEV